MNVGKVQLAVGAAASELLRQPDFVGRWRRLHAVCSYATCFQAPAFAQCWYEAYHEDFVPVVAWQFGGDDELDALWLLALDPSTRELVHAGSYQAEYHVWMSRPDDSTSFVEAAWRLLIQEVDFAHLRFKYLPDGMPLRVLRSIPEIGKCMVSTARHRPLMQLDAADIAASLHKKGNRSRYNRLRRLGHVEFKRVTRADELASLIDDIIMFYDFRQGAMHDTTPFRDDARKRAFHLSLFTQPETTSHVTVTSVNGSAVAALWGNVTASTVHVAMLAYSPLLAAHSPGKLHLMSAAGHLMDNGFRTLDLTPGDDPWKERFANASDVVADVTVFRSSRARRYRACQEATMRIGAAGLRKFGTQPANVRRAVRSLKRATPDAALRRVKDFVNESREFRVYRADRVLASTFPADQRVRENCVASLLRFEPGEPWQTLSQFLRSAYARLEAGESVFTITIDGRLAHSGWCARGQTQSYSTEVGQTIQLPPGSVALYDFYSSPAFRRQGLYRATIGHMLSVAVRDPDARYFYISVLANNWPSRRVIESMNFDYQGSLYRKRRWGIVTGWADSTLCPPRGDEAQA